MAHRSFRVVGINGAAFELDGDADECIVDIDRVDSAGAILNRAQLTELVRSAYYMLHGTSTVAIAKVDRPVQVRIDFGDYVRASGDAVCGVNGCNFKLREHTEVRGFPTLHIRCDGALVKL